MADVLRYNITALSEESGELALGLLTKSLNPQNRGEFESANNQWRRVRLLHEARLLDCSKPSAGSLHRKFRFVGTAFSIYPYLLMLNCISDFSAILYFRILILTLVSKIWTFTAIFLTY